MMVRDRKWQVAIDHAVRPALERLRLALPGLGFTSRSGRDPMTDGDVAFIAIGAFDDATRPDGDHTYLPRAYCRQYIEAFVNSFVEEIGKQLGDPELAGVVVASTLRATTNAQEVMDEIYGRPTPAQGSPMLTGLTVVSGGEEAH